MTATRSIHTMQSEAIERLGTVAVLRARRDELLAEKQEEEAHLAETMKPLTDALADVNAQLSIAETEAKALALAVYEADPTNKKPVPGAAIRVKLGVEYDRAKAFVWATAKGLFITPPALDEKALTKFLLGEPKTDDFAYTITETPTVALDSALPLPVENT